MGKAKAKADRGARDEDARDADKHEVSMSGAAVRETSYLSNSLFAATELHESAFADR